MRVSFPEDSCRLAQSDLTTAVAPIARPFQMNWSVHYARCRKRVALLVSRWDHCLTDLLWRWDSGELALGISCIFSNHPDMEPVAQPHHIPYYLFPIRQEHRPDHQKPMFRVPSGHVDFLLL